MQGSSVKAPVTYGITNNMGAHYAIDATTADRTAGAALEAVELSSIIGQSDSHDTSSW